MNKKNIVDKILLGKTCIPSKSKGFAFAPSNIALCKYWGKRDNILNLPVTGSLSISLGDKGASTTIYPIEAEKDVVVVNGNPIDSDVPFVRALSSYLDLFRSHSAGGHSGPPLRFHVDTNVNIPIAAGLASSACGFAALAKALDNLYGWELEASALSILARLGSGSASRSIWNGFVEWQKGNCPEGLDSHGVLIPVEWPELRVGLLIFRREEKTVSSRIAMETTVKTSPFYARWPEVVDGDLTQLRRAIMEQDFKTVGEVSEANALAMHALMMTAKPSIVYSEPETLKAQQQIWACRHRGLQIYFTQDAGPNLKLLFLEKDLEIVKREFVGVEVLAPFGGK